MAPTSAPRSSSTSNAGLRDSLPDAVVLVATLRALKMHGGVERGDLERENVEAVGRGFANLERHVRNLRGFGTDPIVAINHFAGDHAAELTSLDSLCQAAFGATPILCRHWAEGAPGAETLAKAVTGRLDGQTSPPALILSYPDEAALETKMRTIARAIYGASDIAISAPAARQLRQIEAEGHGMAPVCFAKTPYSFSADPAALGAPTGHILPVDSIRLMAGAGFVTALCGEVRTMPGLPRHPAALDIRLEAGRIEGLT